MSKYVKSYGQKDLLYLPEVLSLRSGYLLTKACSQHFQKMLCNPTLFYVLEFLSPKVLFIFCLLFLSFQQ